MARSSKTKGNNAERIACIKLAQDGWLVDRKPTSRYSSRKLYASQDYFTHFDILAIKGTEMRLIQVKYEKRWNNSSKAMKEIREWKETYSVQFPCEVWQMDHDGEWRIEVV